MTIKLMVVDDSPIICKMIKRVLEPQGIEVVFYAENGQVCLDNYDEFKPDVITMDVSMPVLDGLDTSRALIAKYPDVKIILMSSMSDDTLVETAKEIGIKYFASKPIDGDELFKVINEILGL